MALAPTLAPTPTPPLTLTRWPNPAPHPHQVEYLCLVEVWHTAGGNEIRQAEGPRPRTIPGPEARERLEPYDPNPNPNPDPNPNPPP